MWFLVLFWSKVKASKAKDNEWKHESEVTMIKGVILNEWSAAMFGIAWRGIAISSAFGLEDGEKLSRDSYAWSALSFTALAPGSLVVVRWARWFSLTLRAELLQLEVCTSLALCRDLRDATRLHRTRHWLRAGVVEECSRFYCCKFASDCCFIVNF